jgi:TDG/mug DNA glycosylase family protein
VLGSLPGEASLAAGRYYAHPRNAFWRLMGEVVGEDLASLDYDDRLARLLANRIGLWDVVGEATRPGSLDGAIRDPIHNDLAKLVESLPDVRAVAFNGGKAAKAGLKLLSAHARRLTLYSLPSSSPALTLPLSAKAEAWAVLRDALTQEAGTGGPRRGPTGG